MSERFLNKLSSFQFNHNKLASWQIIYHLREIKNVAFCFAVYGYILLRWLYTVPCGCVRLTDISRQIVYLEHKLQRYIREEQGIDHEIWQKFTQVWIFLYVKSRYNYVHLSTQYSVKLLTNVSMSYNDEMSSNILHLYMQNCLQLKLWLGPFVSCVLPNLLFLFCLCLNIKRQKKKFWSDSRTQAMREFTVYSKTEEE